MLDIFAYDQSILSAFTSPELSVLKPFFFVLTELGSPLALLIYSAIMVAIGNTKIRKIGAVLVISILFGNVISESMKYLFQRPRPYAGIAPAYLYTNDYSFPSGHAVTAFLVATIILAYLGWKYGAISYIVAFLIGTSRIALDVHYPSDVLGGAMIGIMIGELALFAAYRLGIRESRGIISHFIQARGNDTGVKNTNIKTQIGSKYYFIIVALLLIPIMIFYNMKYFAFAISDFALVSYFIIYALPYISGERSPMVSVVAVILVGAISSYSTLMLGGYIVSIILVFVTYLMILLMGVKYADILGTGKKAD